MKVAVVGSRGLGGKIYPLLQQEIPPNVSEIISGGALGVDSLAERYALERGLPAHIIYPDYKLFAARAPLVRNGQIVDESDFVLVIWNGRSRGTANVIMSCIRKNKPFRVLLVRM